MQTQPQQIPETISGYTQRNKTQTQTTSVLIDYPVHDNRSRDAPSATIQGYIEKARRIGIN